MTLVQNNQLKVTDLVSKYIPEYDTNQKRNTTIANLLMHSSGLLYDYPGPLPATVDDVYNYIYLCKPSFPVGTKFSYSNLGFVVLAKIV
jgi:CubicO group peptidase (beta-lactamase class C family)